MAMSTYPALAHHHHHYQSAQQQMHDTQGRGTAAASAHSTLSLAAALDLDLSNLSLQDAPHRQQQQQRQHQHPSLQNLHQQHYNSRASYEEPLHHTPQGQRSARSYPNDFVHPQHAVRSSQPTLFQPQPFGASNAPPDHPLHATTKLDTPRRRGVVKFFNSLKGFGFIVDNDPAALGGQEVFCHFSAISGKGGFRSLAEASEVEYELVQGPKGFQATNLTGPQGRTVVGDPKARMTKPPPYMPFAMPQFLSTDPYAPQGGVFAAGSPYNLVYVPASVAVSPSQFNGYGHALAPGREARHGTSPFGANYSFTPPGPPAGAAGSSSHTNGVDPSRGGSGSDSDHYSSSLSAPTSHPSSRGGVGAPSATAFGTTDFGNANASFDGDSRRDQRSNNQTNGSSFGFAPFSPASSSQLPLFDDGARSARPFDSHLTPLQTHGPSSNRPSSRGSLISASSVSGSAASSLLPAPSSVFDNLRPAPIGSRSRSPATCTSRGTPLGNGSLSSNEWKSSPVLYTSVPSSGEH
ncbi:BQ2448_114 [Microbotryum intermedium]|uniref:BQ2448_114 protein n=1 Tax=Microbotryum intermedium TaxID=269621 RepID=A0A238F7J6_9BASI|nr:BQ2448_114 [Microbotryum intermedium]